MILTIYLNFGGNNVKFNEIINIIRDLNSGSIIPNIPDEKAYHELGSELCKLVIDNFNKYYFLANFEDNISVIEGLTINNDKAYLSISRPIPNSSYLICFYCVDKIDTTMFKKVISLEENEFFYKKYIFYYTIGEYEAFIQWYEKQKSVGYTSIESLICLDEVTAQIQSPHIQFFLRLLIKLPFICIDFKQSNLMDFPSIISEMIDGIRTNKQDILTLDKLIDEALNNQLSVDEISNILFTFNNGDEYNEL